MKETQKFILQIILGLLNTIKVLIFAFDIKENFLGLKKMLKLSSAYVSTYVRYTLLKDLPHLWRQKCRVFELWPF